MNNELSAKVSLAREIDALRNRVYNLELYLKYVKDVDPGLWGAMSDEFVNLPDNTVWTAVVTDV